MSLSPPLYRPKPKGTRAPLVKTRTVPAPVRGLNYKDSLAAMKDTDALRLDNVLCTPGWLEPRQGRQATATGFAAKVETLFPYTSVAGANKLFAASNGSIYDATSSGAIGAAVVTGNTSNYWNQAQVSNSAGNYLMLVNGADTAQIYDGSTWAALGFTGLATTSMINIAVWKRRVWVVEKNSTNAWYGATDAISGPMTQFTFSGIFKRGGRLQAILNWTVDGGSGSDDYFVAVTSMGEVAIYKGTDPTSASTFALVGVYFIGPPIGERFWAQLGGDLLLLTQEGLIPLSRYLQSQTVDRSVILTDRIQKLISQDISSYGLTQGWEVHVFFDANFLFIQVPAGTNSRYQYVMSLITGAWSRFLHSGAQTWAVQAASLYMGDSAQVNNAWTGGTDGSDPIQVIVIPAFSYFGEPTRQKKFSLGRTLLNTAETPVYQTQLLVNFSQNGILFPALARPPTPSNVWDVAIWDSSIWGELQTYSEQWYSLAGLGYSATQVVYLLTASTGTQIIALDYVWEPGGLL